MKHAYCVLLTALLLATPACRQSSSSAPATEQQASAALPARAPALRPVLHSLHPSSTYEGAPFNLQPNRQSAIAVRCENATRNTVIVFGSTALPTVFGSDSLLTAVVPSELFARRGNTSVILRDERGESNPQIFAVRPLVH